MNKHGFHISKLHIAGVGVETAKLEFDSGFNVISGLSDTGKSYVFACINYMLGGGDPPKVIPEGKAYSDAYLEIKTKDDVFTLYRKLSGGGFKLKDVKLEFFLTKGNSTNLLANHSSINPDNISSFLLSLCGFDKPLVKKNKQNLTRELSFRDIAKLTLIDEERIITERSPVYSGQYTDQTQEQSIFKLLLTGKDDSGLNEIEEEKVYKGRIKGKIELIEKYIDNTSIKLSEFSKNSFLDDNLIVEEKISALNELLTDSSKELEKLSKTKAKLFNSLTEIKSKIIHKTELLNRFVLLEDHYNSDIKRLEFITQGDDYFSQLSSVNCPICGGDLDKEHYDCIDGQNSKSSSIIESIQNELIKIIKKRTELLKTIEQVKGEIKELEENSFRISKELDIINNGIQSKLVPIQISTKKQIEELMARLSNINLVTSLNTDLENFYKQRSDLLELQDKRPAIAEKSEGIRYSVLKSFCDKIKEILVSWDFEDIVSINFDTSYKVYDIVINDKNRKAHGKGFRAIIYSAFTIALMEYCSEHDLPTSGNIVLDSPLTTFQGKEANSTEEEITVDIENAFFETLATTTNDMQIIVFDNKDPQDSIKRTINYIHFTGGKSLGRHGFFPV